MDEDHPLLPETPYASAKAGADRAVFSFFRSFRIPAVLVRPFNNYGPHQHLEKFIPRTITSLLLDEKIVIHGDGEMSRDWVYVEDTVDAVLGILDYDKKDILGEVFNIANGKAVSIKDIARMIVKIMRGEDAIEKHLAYQPNRSGQVQKHIGSAKRALEKFGWRPRHPLEEGLARTIEWYTKNRPWWERQLHLRQVPVRASNGQIVYW
jgi:dTDP-glucose 4,6-dehydratase